MKFSINIIATENNSDYTENTVIHWLSTQSPVWRIKLSLKGQIDVELEPRIFSLFEFSQSEWLHVED